MTSIMFHPEKREIELKWTITASAPFMGDAVKVIVLAPSSGPVHEIRTLFVGIGLITPRATRFFLVPCTRCCCFVSHRAKLVAGLL